MIIAAERHPGWSDHGTLSETRSKTEEKSLSLVRTTVNTKTKQNQKLFFPGPLISPLCFLCRSPNGGVDRENRQGKDLGGF